MTDAKGCAASTSNGP